MKKNIFFVIALFMPHIDSRRNRRVSSKCYIRQTFTSAVLAYRQTCDGTDFCERHTHSAVRYAFHRNEHVYEIYSAKGAAVLPRGIAPPQAEMVGINNSFTPAQQGTCPVHPAHP